MRNRFTTVGQKCFCVVEEVLQTHINFKRIQENIAIASKMSDAVDEVGQQQTKKCREPEGKTSNTNSCALPRCRRLAAFDFDYTVVAQNTDTVVRDLLLPDKLPKELAALIDSAGWTEYMAAVFRLLHQHHFTPTKLRDTIRAIPEVPGFVRLIKRLRQYPDFDLIIISDSNSVFIWEWLQAHNVADCFAAVFTNPAHFEDGGLLCISPYHHQTDCRLSAPNLCKGKVLEHYVMEQNLRHNVRYESVIYVGDGNNDICPAMRLRANDIACARRGYAMEKSLSKNSDKIKLRAQLLHWQAGFDLLEQLEMAFQRQEKEKKQKET